ncbi:MAG TPA: arylsulfatase [Burkholderiales bacterium]|nr:arylsulfatase [Burkholderiales bacterium]
MRVALRLASALLACIVALGCTVTHVGAADRPNIVYILADDLGWKDVGFHGGSIMTPNLDGLAQRSARLERFYSEPYSTSTRAALLTGRYPMRYGLQTLSILPWSQYGLPTGERLLPEALKEAGYRTVMLGKWQLGHYKKGYWPTQRGFDSFYGSFSGGLDCLRKTNQSFEPDWHRDERLIKEDGYCTTLLGKEAVRVIEKHDTARSLFLFLSFSAPQAPLRATKEYLNRYKDVRDEQRRTYAAMVTALDEAIGKVIAALEKKSMAADTLLVFQSDNGGAVPNKYPTGDGDVQKEVSDNGPYRDGKGSLYEGSLRVVALASWPGKIPAGVLSESIHVTDMYPTLLRLAGAKLAQPKPVDGVDQWETLTGAKLSPRKEMLLGMEDFRGALMTGNWKLIVYSRLPVRYELYNVLDDPSEEDNHAERESERVQEMLVRLNEFAWEMAPSLYLEDLLKPRTHATPAYWGDNPVRP